MTDVSTQIQTAFDALEARVAALEAKVSSQVPVTQPKSVTIDASQKPLLKAVVTY